MIWFLIYFFINYFNIGDIMIINGFGNGWNWGVGGFVIGYERRIVGE